MSINVGSNFLYQGKKYLDDRKNKAKTIEDLKSWNIPIPDGFEIFVNDSWYIYNSSNQEDEKTGKFKKRTEITQDFGKDTEKTVSQFTVTEKFNEVDENIEKLFSSVFPLEFRSITGGGTYEIGSVITPKLTWTVGIKGEQGTVTPDVVTVNNSNEGISTDLKSYTGSEISLDSPGNKQYQLCVKYRKLEETKNINYSFCFKKYYGTSIKPVLESSDILKMNNAFILDTSYYLDSTIFNCTGGKYPYYIIPKLIYKESLEFWINGLRNTDLIIKDVLVRTTTGLSLEYTTIRLKNIQTGKLSIQIK